MLAIFNCISSEWTLGIGDPEFYGWFVAGLYGLVALLALCVARHGIFPSGYHQRGAALWVAIALLSGFLALNKQLDLQSLIITAGRCFAQGEGWYESRRLVQRDFILGLALLLGLAAFGLVWFFGFLLRKDALLVLGLAAMAGFVLIRAMHFFHVLEPTDPTLDRMVHALTTGLEAIGPMLVLVSEVRILRVRGDTLRRAG